MHRLSLAPPLATENRFLSIEYWLQVKAARFLQLILFDILFLTKQKPLFSEWHHFQFASLCMILSEIQIGSIAIYGRRIYTTSIFG